MALDFQQVRQQIKQLGELAPARAAQRRKQREQALAELEANANSFEGLRQKVTLTVSSYDPTLRCALPTAEPLTDHFPAPQPPKRVTILAADGSQIEPDRHLEVEFGLINVGAICMQTGASEAPTSSVRSQLLYDEDINSLSVATLALKRDLHERTILADLAESARAPVITFTDGPMELWGGRIVEGGYASEFQTALNDYKEVLQKLHRLDVATAGYVDRPGSRTVVRLLEVALTPEERLPDIKRQFPLRGVRDIDLFIEYLQPGERSAIFQIQSQFSGFYAGALAQHFFYLNVGRAGYPWLARVEIPAWVVKDRKMLDDLHATLVGQCRVMGNQAYPYLLHRAHEVSVVTLEEKKQITQMIVSELLRQGVKPGEASHKGSIKELSGRTSFKR